MYKALDRKDGKLVAIKVGGTAAGHTCGLCVDMHVCMHMCAYMCAYTCVRVAWAPLV